MPVADYRPRAARRIAPEPVAIIDIGSNSVRLVIYDAVSRRAAALHNEKTICAIGRNMVSTGRLDETGIALALESLARFRQLCDGYGVRRREAVATAAARDAANGREFVAKAEKVLGSSIGVLSGEEEARLAAEGVVAGIPDADGLVADLGGGSLDMVTVKDGRTGAAATLPFGPLRLMDVSNGDRDKAAALVAKGIERSPIPESLKGRSLYAVGGAWRALAHVDMEQQDYALRVLHCYAMPAARVLKLCGVVSGLSRKSLEKMKTVSRRRAEALPYGALVLAQLVERMGLKEVVISAYGLREGMLYRHLPPEEAAKDPLIEFAADVNERESRVPGHAGELFRWMTPLFPKETGAERRIRQAACFFSDIAWRRHPDDRAPGIFQHVLHAPYAGASHGERMLLATAMFHRYAGAEHPPKEFRIGALLDAESTGWSLRVGLACRFAYGLSGAIEGRLPGMGLHVTPQTVALEVPARNEALVSESIAKRFADLAEAMGKKAQIVVT